MCLVVILCKPQSRNLACFENFIKQGAVVVHPGLVFNVGHKNNVAASLFHNITPDSSRILLTVIIVTTYYIIFTYEISIGNSKKKNEKEKTVAFATVNVVSASPYLPGPLPAKYCQH